MRNTARRRSSTPTRAASSPPRSSPTSRHGFWATPFPGINFGMKMNGPVALSMALRAPPVAPAASTSPIIGFAFDGNPAQHDLIHAATGGVSLLRDGRCVRVPDVRVQRRHHADRVLHGGAEPVRPGPAQAAHSQRVASMTGAGGSIPSACRRTDCSMKSGHWEPPLPRRPRSKAQPYHLPLCRRRAEAARWPRPPPADKAARHRSTRHCARRAACHASRGNPARVVPYGGLLGISNRDKVGKEAVST